MIQNSGAVSQQFLANLQLLQQQMATTQHQISSGTKISQASDAPNSVGDVLQLESDLGRVNQVTSNLNLVSGRSQQRGVRAGDRHALAGSGVESRGAGRRQHGVRREPQHFLAASGTDPIFAGCRQPDSVQRSLCVRRRSADFALLPGGSHQSERRGSPGNHAVHAL